MNGNRFRWTLSELNGALGDTGTLLPLMIGAITVGGLSPTPVLLGFAVAYVATGLVYRLPVPVQPMKAVAALLLAGGATPGAVALSGVMIGVVLLALGATGAIDRLSRLVPRSILAGLRLGLGLGLAWVAAGLTGAGPMIAAGAFLVLIAARRAGAPATILVLVFGMAVAGLAGVPGPQVVAGWLPVAPRLPGLAEAGAVVTEIVLPQLALTLTNAVVLTALVAGDLFGDRAAQVTPRRLCLSSGLLNCLLAPFGALPMCHGAGGLAAHHGSGARSGAAPGLAGGLLLLAALPGGPGIALLASIPPGVLGVLLFVAAVELANDRRLRDSRASCYPVIGVTAAVSLAFDPFAGLMAGTVAEILRKAVLRLLAGRRGRWPGE